MSGLIFLYAGWYAVADEHHPFSHGDIEDTLLTILLSKAAGGREFSKMDVKRTYFGNWLRDYSQAVDVGTLKMVSAEAIRILLWVLGFMSFGYGTKEFEVTTERLGCYRPEEHIDNPKDYADNEDARRYDPRLRGPVNEKVELAINPRTGLKNYIASEGIGIDTSAALIRKLFGRSIELGRQYARSKNKSDLYEALRLLGTGCHCLEDYSAHSNYTELALIELGERDVFPHVGRRTTVNLGGRQVYPIITGTFGAVDFLHSVCGEFTDKVTQSEISQLQGTMSQAENSGTGSVSILQSIISKLPSGLFGGNADVSAQATQLQANSQAAQAQQQTITPKRPEEWTKQLQNLQGQIYPILEWHDNLMQGISEAIEKIPVLPDLIEQFQDEISMFVFSLLAPFVIPIIDQVQAELKTGSTEIIQSSKDKQLIVFHDDNSSDPTHSMLSKDHFSNVLNEPAGKVASAVLKWVVPQLITCWDDERGDPTRTINRIIAGVFHHPAQRDTGDDFAVDGRRAMFNVVQTWWGSKPDYEKQELRQQLGRDGVMNGRNHKAGVQDSGHGSCKPLGMPNMGTAKSSGAPGGTDVASVISTLSQALGGSSLGGAGQQGGMHGRPGQSSNFGGALGGGAMGGLVGGLVGAAGTGLLVNEFQGSEGKHHSDSGFGSQGGGYGQSYGGASSTQGYGNQAQYSQSGGPGGYGQTYGGADSSAGYAGQAQYPQSGGNLSQQYGSNTYQQPAAQGYGTGYGDQTSSGYGGGYGGGYQQPAQTGYGSGGSQSGGVYGQTSGESYGAYQQSGAPSYGGQQYSGQQYVGQQQYGGQQQYRTEGQYGQPAYGGSQQYGAPAPAPAQYGQPPYGNQPYDTSSQGGQAYGGAAQQGSYKPHKEKKEKKKKHHDGASDSSDGSSKERRKHQQYQSAGAYPGQGHHGGEVHKQKKEKHYKNRGGSDDDSD